MKMDHEVKTKWTSGLQFTAETPGGTLTMAGGGEEGLGPKALMLDALAGCTAMDVASLIPKMRLKVDTFYVNAGGALTEDHPRTYHTVDLEYVFEGSELDKEKLQQAVDLSVEKYCGVMEMFRQFAKLNITVRYN